MAWWVWVLIAVTVFTCLQTLWLGRQLSALAVLVMDNDRRRAVDDEGLSVQVADVATKLNRVIKG